MKLRDWMRKSTHNEKISLADACHTSCGYLFQMAGGHKQPSWKMAQKLEKATMELTPDRIVLKQDLRPDIAQAFNAVT